LLVQFSGTGNQADVNYNPRPEKDTFSCPICKKPINLDRDRYADENGKVIHESCYLQRLMSYRNDPPDPSHAQ